MDLVIERLSAPSLRGILQFGFGVPYSTLKNYSNESRLLPEDFFDDICGVANIDKAGLDYEFVEGNWGKVKGGQIGRRKSEGQND